MNNFNYPHQPVIDILWHEAMMYCQWLSEKTSYTVELPTLAQWTRAAVGNTGYLYPWGNEWDSSKCNSEDNKINRTTVVTQYPQGQSVFGVMDMTGNVEEWTSTDSKTGLPVSKLVQYTDIELFSEQERVFMGGDYTSSTVSCAVNRIGATLIWSPYVSGIRLVVNIN